jgi:hypothetical protein
MNPIESPSTHQAANGLNPASPEPKIQLVAIDEILHQDDVALLKQQLAAAHQLLAYRQDVVHSLTEQITLKDAYLSQAEQQSLELKHQCNSQQIELAEAHSICSDLRELLKRQQRRCPSQLSQSAKPDKRGHVFHLHSRDLSQRDSISFGYETSIGISGQPNQPLSTKAPPVEAWSSHSGNSRQDEAIFCQRLTTFVVSPPNQISESPAKPRLKITTEIIAQNPISSKLQPVQLPRFAMS